MITTLQIDWHYVLNVHEVHKSLTLMGHYGRSIIAKAKIDRVTPRQRVMRRLIRFSKN